MSETFGIRNPEALINTVRASENELEESLREINLADKLFHQAHLMEALATPQAIDQLGRLQSEFLKEKRGMNMGERFALALSDKYLGKIHVVELGSTSNPGATGEVDGLKDEYRDLLHWMKAHGIVEDELPRSRSGRYVEFRNTVVPEARDKLVIMTRNRPLIDTTIEHGSYAVRLGLGKRMVFSMPRTTLHALNGGTPDKDYKFNDTRSLALIETMLQHGTGGVEPIRTAYYMATDVLEA